MDPNMGGANIADGFRNREDAIKETKTMVTHEGISEQAEISDRQMRYSRYTLTISLSYRP